MKVSQHGTAVIQIVLSFTLTGVAFLPPLSLRKPNFSTPRRSFDLKRGENYGAANNSTIPTAAESAAAVGVRPPLDVSAKVWKRAWLCFGATLPVLHALDSHKPPDSKLALHCLWWKALSGNDRRSPVYDENLAYDLLPRMSRVVVGKKLRRFFPRLHHANVEIRTAFLDRAVSNLAQEMKGVSDVQIRLITLGAGYDVRSIKLVERGIVDQAVELDLPSVVEAKSKILNSKRFKRRRPWLTKRSLPELYPVNLNQLMDVENILQSILLKADDSWHTIFLFEGVMIYLDEGVPAGLLELTSRVLHATGGKGSLVFADRLENIPGGDLHIGREELARNGWEITEWLPKPGLARHMGCAKLT